MNQRNSQDAINDPAALHRKKVAERRVAERRQKLEMDLKKLVVSNSQKRALEKQREMEKEKERRASEESEKAERAKAQALFEEREKTRDVGRRPTNTSKTIAFGSSTPRGLSYLVNLPKEEQIYDKKLVPRNSGDVLSGSPSRRGVSAAMTSSMYSTKPITAAKGSLKTEATPAARMTRSLYLPSRTLPQTSVKPPVPGMERSVLPREKRVPLAGRAVKVPLSKPPVAPRSVAGKKEVKGELKKTGRPSNIGSDEVVSGVSKNTRRSPVTDLNGSSVTAISIPSDEDKREDNVSAVKSDHPDHLATPDGSGSVSTQEVDDRAPDQHISSTPESASLPTAEVLDVPETPTAATTSPKIADITSLSLEEPMDGESLNNTAATPHDSAKIASESSPLHFDEKAPAGDSEVVNKSYPLSHEKAPVGDSPRTTTPSPQRTFTIATNERSPMASGEPLDDASHEIIATTPPQSNANQSAPLSSDESLDDVYKKLIATTPPYSANNNVNGGLTHDRSDEGELPGVVPNKGANSTGVKATDHVDQLKARLAAVKARHASPVLTPSPDVQRSPIPAGLTANTTALLQRIREANKKSNSTIDPKLEEDCKL